MNLCDSSSTDCECVIFHDKSKIIIDRIKIFSQLCVSDLNMISVSISDDMCENSIVISSLDLYSVP